MSDARQSSPTRRNASVAERRFLVRPASLSTSLSSSERASFAFSIQPSDTAPRNFAQARTTRASVAHSSRRLRTVLRWQPLRSAETATPKVSASIRMRAISSGVRGRFALALMGARLSDYRTATTAEGYGLARAPALRGGRVVA